MKQHITLEQIRQLNIDSILNRMEKGTKDSFSKLCFDYDSDFALRILCFDLTIGTMIEIINKVLLPTQHFYISGTEFDSYEIKLTINDLDGIREIEQLVVNDDCLCDALFEFLKELNLR